MNTPSNRRKRPAPSTRDQQIYLDYQISGRRQTDLAGEHKLTQCRISQIIRRVAAWRSQVDAREENEPTPRQQQQLDRFLEHERLNFIAREALRLFRDEQKTVTKKSGTRGDNAFDETTERIAPANVQFLKVALQATRQLSQLEQKPALPFAEPDAPVTPSDGPDAIQRFFGTNIGEPSDSQRPDPAMRELSQAILPECERQTLTRSASEDDSAEPCPTLNLEPGTLNSPVPSSTSRHDPNSPQPQPPPPLPTQNPKSKIENPPSDLHTRRLLHHQKLIALREARRNNLPHNFFFDHADGPPPPPPAYLLDGAP